MPHLYDKAPPAFARDPWAWDYTRDRMEGNSGLPYDKWEGKHFAGAAAMYKNVIKKYGASVKEGVMTMPHECVDCGNVAQHYEGDYVCKDCRDKIEAAPTYEAAAATVSNPDSIDAIREKLYKALGHDKKDAKAGRTPPKASAYAQYPVTAGDAKKAPPQVTQYDSFAPTCSRNYKAMGDDKLARSIAELEAGSGEAVTKAQAKGESIDDHLEAALRAAQEKGL